MSINVASPLVGKRYLVQDRLGQGGMGTVYRVLDRLTGQVAALKQVSVPAEQLIFLTRTDAYADQRLSLAKEFQLLASLRHPNIISVLDYGFDEDRHPYFTMELLEDAQNLLVAGRSQPLAVQIGLIGQVLQALVYLHRRGILHRDLK